MSFKPAKPPERKTLYPCQNEAFLFFLNLLRQGHSTLDTSDVGTGKTVVAIKLAAALAQEGRQVFVVCPKSVIPMWGREFDAEGQIKPLGILNYEMLRGGRTEWVGKKFKRVMTWNLPVGSVIFFDEVHNCKGATTQNAQLLVAAIQQGYATHCMSATAAEDPTEMRALGYALGLHSLNSEANGLVPWMRWMRRHGCVQDAWHNWQVGKRCHIAPIKERLYNSEHARAHKLTVAHFPDSFRENRVFIEALDFGDKSAIHDAYAENGITPQIVEDFIENGTVGGNDCVLVDLLRARQLAESYKLPLISNMVDELVSEGHSVPVFLNFRESIEYLRQSLSHLDPRVVQGGQSGTERDDAIVSFQSDETRVLLINVAAGGTGISLHDINGTHPRVSLVSPSFNAKQHLQTLGRIHRNGAHTDAVQKILVAAGTVEEDVMKAIDRKITNMNTIL